MVYSKSKKYSYMVKWKLQPNECTEAPNRGPYGEAQFITQRRRPTIVSDMLAILCKINWLFPLKQFQSSTSFCFVDISSLVTDTIFNFSI